MRRRLVIGNWKMNGSRGAAAELIQELKSTLVGASATVAVCPPFVYLAQLETLLQGSAIALGAQNLSAEPEGAFTGEVSATMLREFGCRYVLVGHSERRALYGEDDAAVARKVQAALGADLIPVVCIGETLAQRDAGATLEVIAAQMDAVLAQTEPAALPQLVWAYEPVWAIGTGRTAEPAQAQEVHAFVRERLRSVSPEAAQVSVLYGGSVKADNAAQLFAQTDVDGGLVGGASLNAAEFSAICRAAE
jgi:triosephosphate isomerase